MASMGLQARTEEWHATRRGLLTASDCAAVLGVGRGSRWQVWASKLNPDLDPIEPGYQKRGHYLEPAVAKWFADESGASVVDHNELEVFDGWLGATIDADVTHPDREGVGVYEGKTTDERMLSEWEGGVPVWPAVQCQIGMHVLDRKWGAIACLCGLGPDPMRWAFIERDDAFLETALPKLREFWERHVRDAEEPRQVADDRALLTALRPQSTESLAVYAEGELDREGADLLEIKRKMKALKTRGEGIAARIQGYMQDAELIFGSGWKATYKTGKKSRPFNIKEHRS